MSPKEKNHNEIKWNGQMNEKVKGRANAEKKQDKLKTGRVGYFITVKRVMNLKCNYKIIWATRNVSFSDGKMNFPFI